MVSARWKEARRSFFAGLLVVVPVAGSIIIILTLFNWITNFLLPASLRVRDFTFFYRLAALAIFVVLTTLVGWVTRLVIGKRMISVTEMIISRVPLLNKTYGFMKEISHTLLAGHKTMFKRVVLVEYPRTGVYTVGFVTSDARGEAQNKTPTDVLNVFFPTTPNPTSGWLALVPRDQVIDLDMSVGDGMKLIISGGVVTPPDKTQPAVTAT